MKRRKRYTVTLSDSSQHVILAFDALDARLYYTQRFGRVASVSAGDYRLQPTEREWQLNYAALRDAKKELGLTLPITVRKNGRQGSTNATYRLKPEGHHIVVKSYLTRQEATESLWHELQHAQQAERVGATAAAWKAEHDRQKKWPYKKRPMEIEARRTAAANAHKSLTR